MALSEYSLRLINKLVKTNQPKKILFLSCPDLLVTKEQIEEIFKCYVSDLKYRSDSEEILHWHAGYKKKIKGVLDTEQIFKRFGWDCTYFDIVKARGPEILYNLNEYDELKWISSFDLIIDNVIQHCFNIGTAMRNIVSLLNIGGRVFHLNPCMMPNNGFYNLNPEFYHNFYLSNGFEIEYTEVTAKNIHLELKSMERVPSFDKFEGNVKLIVIVKKKQEVREITWPIQFRFQENPYCKIK